MNWADCPAPIVAEVGLVDTVTLEEATVMVTPTANEDMSEPDVPVALIVYAPATVLDWVEIVSRDAPDPITVLGEKEAVTPEGRLEAIRATVPLKPPVEATSTVNVAEPPAVI